MVDIKNKEYKIIEIKTLPDALKFGKVGNYILKWQFTHDKDNYSTQNIKRLTRFGNRLFIMCEKNYETEKPDPRHSPSGTNYRNLSYDNINTLDDRLDDFGLSMIAFVVDVNCNLLLSVTRYDNWLDDIYVSERLISRLLKGPIKKYIPEVPGLKRADALEYLKPVLKQLAAAGELNSTFGTVFGDDYEPVCFLAGSCTLDKNFPYMAFINKKGDILKDLLFDNYDWKVGFEQFGKVKVSRVLIGTKKYLLKDDGELLTNQGFDCIDWEPATPAFKSGLIVVSLAKSTFNRYNYIRYLYNVLNDDGDLVLPGFYDRIVGTKLNGITGRSCYGMTSVVNYGDYHAMNWNIFDYINDELLFPTDYPLAIYNLEGNEYQPMDENDKSPYNDFVLVCKNLFDSKNKRYKVTNVYNLKERKYLFDEFERDVNVSDLIRDPVHGFVKVLDTETNFVKFYADRNGNHYDEYFKPISK